MSLLAASAEYISFPSLGWKFSVSPELFSFELFGHEFSIRWYGLLIAIGFLLAIIYGMRRAPSFGIDKDRMTDVVIVAAVLAFIGARLYYVFFSSSRAEYLANPLSILDITKGGLAIYGGVIVAFVTGIWMCRVRKVNTLAMFDLASIGFFIGQAIGRWGNFFNQEAFGGNTTLPWGMSGSIIQAGINGEGYNTALPVHPTFLYESLWCLLGFILLHVLSKKAYKFKGQLFCGYLIWYGLGRFFIESLRTDSLELGTMRVSQLVAVLSVVGGFALLAVFKAKSKKTSKNLFAEEAAVAPTPSVLGGIVEDQPQEESEEPSAEIKAETETAVAEEQTTEQPADAE